MSPLSSLYIRCVRFTRQPLPALLLRVAVSACMAVVIMTGLYRLEQWSVGLSYPHYGDPVPYQRCDIFFLSVATKLTARHACAVEAAVTHHNNATVCIIMTASASGSVASSTMDVISTRSQLNNVKGVFILPLIHEVIFKRTPIEAWWKNDLQYMRHDSPWRRLHVSDAVKVAFLWKYGGLYLDLDMITVGSLFNTSANAFSSMPANFLGLQTASSPVLASTDKDDATVGTAAMRFATRRHRFLTRWLFAMPGAYSEDERNCLGQDLATGLLPDFCLSGPLTKDKLRARRLSNMTAGRCNDELHLLDTEAFYPVPWQEWKQLFVSADAVSSESVRSLFRSASTAGVHTWAELSHAASASPPEDSAFMRLAAHHCPAVFRGSLSTAERRKLAAGLRALNKEQRQVLVKMQRMAQPALDRMEQEERERRSKNNVMQGL